MSLTIMWRRLPKCPLTVPLFHDIHMHSLCIFYTNILVTSGNMDGRGSRLGICRKPRQHDVLKKFQTNSTLPSRDGRVVAPYFYGSILLQSV